MTFFFYLFGDHRDLHLLPHSFPHDALLFYGRRCVDIVVRQGVHAGAERAGRAATADARLAEDGARMGRNLRAAVSGDPGLSARRGIRGGLAPTFYLNLT